MALVRKKEPEPPPPYIPKYDVKIGRTNIITLCIFFRIIICCMPKESCPILYINLLYLARLLGHTVGSKTTKGQDTPGSRLFA